MARRSSSSWPSELPWVLPDLRSVPLEQSGVSSADLVFGTLPTLPGQFLSTPELPPTEFIDNHHHLMDPFIPPPLVHGSSPPSGSMHLPPALWEAKYVFVRHDGARPSLTPLYDGPYRVVHQSDTYFRLAAVTERTRSLSQGSSHSLLRVLWFLPNLVVEDALLISSLLRSLRLFHVVEAVRGKILHLLLLLLSFVVDALPVSTLLTWARRVWGGACNGSETPCNKTRN